MHPSSPTTMVILSLSDRKIMAQQHRSPGGAHVLLTGAFVGVPPSVVMAVVSRSSFGGFEPSTRNADAGRSRFNYTTLY